MNAPHADVRADDARRSRLRVIPFLLFFLLLSVLTLRLPFFWDKDILFSRIAHWLLLHHFSTVLPDRLDPGYPPVLAYLLALSWRIAGISLPVMHLLMLPFTLGIVLLTSHLLRRFIPGPYFMQAMTLMLIDTTLLAQTVVYSTDLVMLFFMLLALEAVYSNRSWLLALAITGMVFSHMRGVMTAAAIGIFDVYRHEWRRGPREWIRRLPPYLPALLLFAGWMLYHFRTKGWIGYHPGSPWAGCYERVDFQGFFRNCVIVIWRMADFGRIFVWLIAGWLLVAAFRNRGTIPPALRDLLVLLAVLLLVTLPAMLLYRELNDHRYLIPANYALSLLAIWLIFNLQGRASRRKWLAGILFFALLSGNFWIYPDTVAKGWDANLAHLPYHALRHQIMRYIAHHHIPVSETGSRTPNTSVIDDIDCNGDQRAFPWADLQTDHYVFYTNISNLFTDAEIHRLRDHWIVEKEARCLQVKVILYRNPDWNNRKK